MNETRVFALSAPAASALEERLRARLPLEAEWRQVDHARFAVKVPDASLVCYHSGKLVVQGRSLDAFVDRFLPELAAAPVAPGAVDPPLPFAVATVGADEAGKGDYFGPLVAAAVHAGPERRAELEAMGVTDSKRLGDQRMLPMAEHIERSFPCEVRALMPAEYNRLWRADPNVNHLLADLHATAISALLARTTAAALVVDRFADEGLLRARLRQRGAVLPASFVQVPRAEAHPVVAAASIVARVHFLEGLRRCEEESGTELHKGAGPPVDAAARRAFEIGGAALLVRIAKVHFRNSQRVPGMGA